LTTPADEVEIWRAMQRTASRLVLAIGVLGGLGLCLPTAAEAKPVTDASLSARPAASAARIAKVRRVQKAKPRSSVVTLRTFKKRVLEIQGGSTYARCTQSVDLGAQDLDDLPVVEELQVASVTWDLYASFERRKLALLIRVAQLQLEDVIYSTDHVRSVRNADVVSFEDARIRIRLLPKLPTSSSDDGSHIA
jgi:hypothetical protein